jgi:hypothetical protein
MVAEGATAMISLVSGVSGASTGILHGLITADPTFSSAWTITESTADLNGVTATVAPSTPAAGSSIWIDTNGSGTGSRLSVISNAGAYYQLAGAGLGTKSSAAGKLFREMVWYTSTATGAQTFFTLNAPTSAAMLYGTIKCVEHAVASARMYEFLAQTTGSATSNVSVLATTAGLGSSVPTIVASASSNNVVFTITSPGGIGLWQCDVEYQIN